MTENQTTANDENTVKLDQPLKRGEQNIESVTLRKPRSGELRGIKLTELLNLDVVALQLLMPRITTPTLTAQDVAALDPADLTELGVRVASFFVRKSIREEYQTA
ncbi:phage tail assembly protein [Comamonas antarctica]|uniref:Phage tail assembly protein n=1 Tax=Comamonas antarctica TaxID=2743470 RepID=A0A6N1X4D6_9BURK|nr:phage tail assembly protein [Comamonas antarctica]QKV52640.1 phage tail assembly protein [Comamonas antarctica]